MHIIIDRTLDTTNLWSRHRTVEVRLCETPTDAPLREQVAAVFRALSHIELPLHLAISDNLAIDEQIPPHFSVAGQWARLVSYVAKELQRAVGQSGFQVHVDQRFHREPTIALECFEFEVAIAALTIAATLVSDILLHHIDNASSLFNQLRAIDEQFSFGGATGPIVAAARDRGIPYFRLDGESRVQLGEGIHARWIRQAATDATSFLAEQASTDKAFTKELWSRMGIPVAPGRVVNDEADAVRAAHEVGWPVVVKPLDSDYSRGVTLNVVDEQGVRAGYVFARTESESVLVERHLVGALHRFLIVDDRVVSAVRRDPAKVIGDGRHTIAELVELENASVRRGPDERWPLCRLGLGETELKFLTEQGLTPDSIPASGQRIELRRDPFLNRGGETHEVLHQVHPSTLAAVLDAVRVIGLDVAGVDLIAREISAPLEEQQGGLLELNAQPGIFLHLAPFNDVPQPVGHAIVESLFPNGTTGRLPLVVAVGETASGDLRPIVAALSNRQTSVARSTADATEVDGRLLHPRSNSPSDRLMAMSLYSRTSARCLGVSLADLLAHGLGTDQCDLLILGDSGAISANDRANIASLLLRIVGVAKSWLVNIDDPVWKSVVGGLGPAAVLASVDGTHPEFERHLQSGGRVLHRDGQEIVLRSQSTELARRPLPRSAQQADEQWLCHAAALLIEHVLPGRRSRTTRPGLRRTDSFASS